MTWNTMGFKNDNRDSHEMRLRGTSRVETGIFMIRYPKFTHLRGNSNNNNNCRQWRKGEFSSER